MNKFAVSLGLSCLLFVGLFVITPQHADAQRQRVKLSITPTANNVFLVARMSRFHFTKISKRGWKSIARLWIRRPSGWVRIGRRLLRRRRWTRAINTRRICKGSYGKVKLVLQLGVRNGKSWWNRYTRRWQNDFMSIRETTGWVQCSAVPDDMPPGSPKGMGTVVAPAQPTAPSQSPFPPVMAPPAQPAPNQPAPNQPAPNQPEPGSDPPPPPLVPAKAFQSFHQSMKDTSFDKGRYRMLRSWLRRLGELRLSAGQIRRVLTTFSFDATRTKAAIRMSRYVLRPLRVRQVIRIIKPFSFGSNKLKATLYYCNGLQDPLNIHMLAKEFSFSSSKRKIMKRCR